MKFEKAFSAFKGFKQQENNFDGLLQFDTRISNSSLYLRRPTSIHTQANKERTVSFDVSNSRKLDLN